MKIRVPETTVTSASPMSSSPISISELSERSKNSSNCWLVTGVPVLGTVVLFVVESARGVDIRIGIIAGVVVGRVSSNSFASVS